MPHVGARPIERVENTKDIDARLGCFADEGPYQVVGIVGIAHRVRRSQQHLEQDVGDPFAQLGQAAPRGIPSRSASRYQRSLRPTFRSRTARGRDGHTRRRWPACRRGAVAWPIATMYQQRNAVSTTAVASVATPRRLALSGPTFQQLACAYGRNRGLGIELGDRRDIADNVRGPVLDQRMPIDGDIGQVCEQLGRAIFLHGKLEQLARFVDETRRAFACQKSRMRDQIERAIDVIFTP